jgi:hypothetical protein
VWGQASGLGGARATLRLEEELFDTHSMDTVGAGVWNSTRGNTSCEGHGQVALPWESELQIVLP